MDDKKILDDRQHVVALNDSSMECEGGKFSIRLAYRKIQGSIYEWGDAT